MSARARTTAWITALALALAPAAAFAEPTPAEKETARSLMKEGRLRREKAEHKAALDAFQGADNIMKVPTTGLEVGRSQTDLHLLVEARDTFLRISRIPEEAGEPAAFKEARKEAAALAAKLEERIPTVRLAITNLPKGAKPAVAIDEANVSSAMLPYPVKVNPGKHTVTASVGAFKKSADVELIEGEDKEVALDMTGAPVDEGPTPAEPVKTEPKPEVPETPAPAKSGTSPLVYAGFAVAGVGIVVGSVTGLLAMSKTNAAKEDCEGTRCPPSTHDDLASARTMATVSTVSFVVGLVGVGVGVYGLLGSSKTSEPPKAAFGPIHRVEPFIGLGTFGLTGSF